MSKSLCPFRYRSTRTKVHRCISKQVSAYCHSMRLRSNLCTPRDVDAFAQSLNQRASQARQRSQQLQLHISRMQQQLTATQQSLHTLLPITHASCVPPAVAQLAAHIKAQLR